MIEVGAGPGFASNEQTELVSLLLSIEDRARLYYISGGKVSGDTPTPTPKPDPSGDGDGD